jgi:hypothetical protein
MPVLVGFFALLAMFAARTHSEAVSALASTKLDAASRARAIQVIDNSTDPVFLDAFAQTMINAGDFQLYQRAKAQAAAARSFARLVGVGGWY